MTNDEIEAIYKSAVGVSFFAGLRAVFDAGYEQALGTTVTPDTLDRSLTVPRVTSFVSIDTP